MNKDEWPLVVGSCVTQKFLTESYLKQYEKKM